MREKTDQKATRSGYKHDTPCGLISQQIYSDPGRTPEKILESRDQQTKYNSGSATEQTDDNGDEQGKQVFMGSEACKPGAYLAQHPSDCVAQRNE